MEERAATDATSKDEVQLADTSPRGRARKAYEEGMSAGQVRHRFHLLPSEAEEIMPEETTRRRPTGAGGY
jgi:hypothetical protein